MAATLTRWYPENLDFWLTRGRFVARRNLACSVFALHLNFNIWMMWSVVVVNLPAVGFQLSTDQRFWLVAIPPLVGAVMRILYSMAWSWIGGANWLALSTLVLLVPALGVGWSVQDIATPYWVLFLMAGLCGIGGGASASHLANISFFFPAAKKGGALGLNAGIGNLGVSVAQLVIPIAITLPLFGSLGGAPQVWGRGDEVRLVWLQNAGFVWVPMILLAAWAAWRFGNNVASARISPKEQLKALRVPHTWRVCMLYMGSYGTFLGFAAAFPLLVSAMFPLEDASGYLFVGPMLAALARPLGGWLSDRISGGVVTCLAYLVMALALAALPLSFPSGGNGGIYPLFVALALILFTAAGFGNGSSYQMSPKIFLVEAGRAARRTGQPVTEVYAGASRLGAAAMNVSSVMAAFGGFFIPKSFSWSLDLTGGFTAAIGVFLLFYVMAIVVCARHYALPHAPVRV